jgi:hypothetical protein
VSLLGFGLKRGTDLNQVLKTLFATLFQRLCLFAIILIVFENTVFFLYKDFLLLFRLPELVLQNLDLNQTLAMLLQIFLGKFADLQTLLLYFPKETHGNAHLGYHCVKFCEQFFDEPSILHYAFGTEVGRGRFDQLEHAHNLTPTIFTCSTLLCSEVISYSSKAFISS